jgi:predicted dehydrogenase
MINVGVVGCARILPAHLRGFKELLDKGLADFRITALCARNIDDARMFQTRGQGPPPRDSVITHAVTDPLNAPHMYVSDLHTDVVPELFTDWREMLRTGKVDAVLVLTTLSLHHQVTLDAIAAGKHVLAEKPFAISVKAGQRMVDAAKASGVALGVAEVVRYLERVRLQKWLLDSGQIGKLQMWISGGMGAPDWSPDVIVAKTPWRHRKLEAGGGPAVDGAVHLFDQIRYICGEIDEISAMAPRLEPKRVIRDHFGDVVESVDNEVEDAYFAHLKFASGAVGTVFGGVAGHGEPTSLRDGPVLYGTKGCIKGGDVVLDGGKHESGQALFDEQVPAGVNERWFPSGIKDGFALELLDFLRSVESGKPMETDGQEAIRDLACSFAVLESATLNQPVKLAAILNGEVDAYQREINSHYGL